jgi:hypothetical protein
LGGAVLKSGSGSGLGLSNGSYILTLESGTRSVSVSRSGYPSKSFTVTVPRGGSVIKNIELGPAPNSPPVISGISDTTVEVGQPFTLVPVASDPDGDSLTFSIIGNPAWMNFSTVTGALSGTPGIEHSGTYGPITITVHDSKGASASLPPFMIYVYYRPGFLPSICLMLRE